MRRSLVAVAAAVAVSTLSACGGGGSSMSSSSSAGSSGTVTVTEHEYSIKLSSTTLKAGPVHFSVKNQGGMPHELVLFKTTLKANALPQKNGVVDEQGSGVEKISPELDNINAGDTKTLDVQLTPGSYVAICNIAGHYQLGMHTAFTVS
ncbi:MAG: copper-binding protein [Acidimicrobiia bacterium]|nr:copper-binding protein [Acidimicrobiia bacterium]MBV8984994.1 copper-binding protein [Acidimicrobiia bacterium]